MPANDASRQDLQEANDAPCAWERPVGLVGPLADPAQPRFEHISTTAEGLVALGNAARPIRQNTFAQIQGISLRLEFLTNHPLPSQTSPAWIGHWPKTRRNKPRRSDHDNPSLKVPHACLNTKAPHLGSRSSGILHRPFSTGPAEGGGSGWPGATPPEHHKFASLL